MSKQFKKPAFKKSESEIRTTESHGDYRVASPVERTDDKGEVSTYWQNIGRAFKTKNGFSISLNALPVGNKLNLFEITEENLRQ